MDRFFVDFGFVGLAPPLQAKVALIAKGSPDWKFLDTGSEPASGWHSVEFDASGQESAASQPLAGPESPPPDGPMGELYVDVVDRGSGDPITSALFKIGSHAAETNDNGLVTFDLPQGTYSYEASAANYASASGTVEVTDDTDLTVELDPN